MLIINLIIIILIYFLLSYFMHGCRAVAYCYTASLSFIPLIGLNTT